MPSEKELEESNIHYLNWAETDKNLMLKVLEAYTINRGTDIVSTDYDIMDMLGCSHGVVKSSIVISNADFMVTKKMMIINEQILNDHPCIICEQYITDHTEEDLRDCIANLEEKIECMKSPNWIYDNSKCPLCALSAFDIVAIKDHKTVEQAEEITISQNKRRWGRKKKASGRTIDDCISVLEVDKEDMEQQKERKKQEHKMATWRRDHDEDGSEVSTEAKRASEEMQDDAKDELNTIAECHQLYPADEGKGIIRIDETIRNSIGVEIGDYVWVRPYRGYLP